MALASTNEPCPEPPLSATEVARILGLSHQSVYQLDEILDPRKVPTPGGRRTRRWYDPRIVRAFAVHRAEIHARGRALRRALRDLRVRLRAERGAA